MARRLAVLLLLLAAGCGPRPDATHDGDPRGPEEAAVSRYVLNQDRDHDPKTVAFLSWGPHDLAGDCALKGHEGEKTVRVVYRARKADGGPEETCDRLAHLDGDAVVNLTPNPFGADWKAHFKELQEEQK